MTKRFLDTIQIERQLGVARASLSKWYKDGLLKEEDRKIVDRKTNENMDEFKIGRSKYMYNTYAVTRIINETGYETKELLDDDKWYKRIKGFDCIYLCSPDGDVGNATTWERYKPYRKKNGYCTVDLYRQGKKDHYKVHQIIMQMFCENGRGCQQGHHIDFNKENNAAENILPCFDGEHRMLHKRFDKLKDLPKGSEQYKKLYDEYMQEVEHIRRLNRGHKIELSEKAFISLTDDGWKAYQEGTSLEDIPSEEIVVEWYGKDDFNIAKQIR